MVNQLPRFAPEPKVRRAIGGRSKLENRENFREPTGGYFFPLVGL